jgi:hypothetical protein
MTRKVQSKPEKTLAEIEEMKLLILKKITLVSDTATLGFYFYKPKTQEKTEIFHFLIDGLMQLNKWKEQGTISEPQRLDLLTILLERNNIIDVSKTRRRVDKVNVVQNALHFFYEIYLNDKRFVRLQNPKEEEKVKEENNTKIPPHARGVL